MNINIILKILKIKLPKIGILYKARSYLDKRALICLYFSYIHSYLNYANTAWCSTDGKNFNVNKSTLLELSFTKTNYTYMGTFQRKYIKHLSIKFFNNLLFLHRVKNGKTPDVFVAKFLRFSHHYPTSFSRNNYSVKPLISGHSE